MNVAKTSHAADEPFLVVRTPASDLSRRATGSTGTRHDWHQLIYASAGVLDVWTERGSWIVPPQLGDLGAGRRRATTSASPAIAR